MNFFGDMMTRQDADTLLELLTEDFMSDETNRAELAAIRAQPLAADEHIKGVTDLIIRSASRSTFGRELVSALVTRMKIEAEGHEIVPSADRPF